MRFGSFANLDKGASEKLAAAHAETIGKIEILSFGRPLNVSLNRDMGE
jgi:hypothetical protein